MKNSFIKKIILVAFLFLGEGIRTLNAQQLPLTSQYMLNEIVLNPAIAGSKEYFVTRLTNRNQWVGIEGSPVTQTLSGHGLIENTNHGVGGFIFNDMMGPFRQTGLEADYAFHIEMNNESKLSLGIQAGIFQYHFNANKVTTTTPDDKVISQSAESKIMPDASFGVHFYNEQYYVGLSTPHLIETKFKLSSFEREKIGHLSRHYLLYGGYKFEPNEDFSIEPSLLVKAVMGAPISVDINSRFTFMNTFWLGTSYRTGDALVLLLGFKLQDKYHFGYSYDITLSALRPYSKGSHEIMIGYDFNNDSSYGRYRGRGRRR